MCELFGMSARRETDVDGSLGLFAPRGGETARHADGWGVALYEGAAARVIKEPRAASTSRCLRLVVEQHVKSPVVVGHIRLANPPQFGRVLANTHPFERELGGRSWVFAHNGKVPDIHDDLRLQPRRFLPIGDTDSEHVFCLFMDRIARLTEDERARPDDLARALLPLTRRLAKRGGLNYLLSDGRSLVVHAHTRLHALTRTCGGGAQQVTLIATVPLTDEPWTPIVPGTLHVYREGVEAVCLPTRAPDATTFAIMGISASPLA